MSRILVKESNSSFAFARDGQQFLSISTDTDDFKLLSSLHESLPKLIPFPEMGGLNFFSRDSIEILMK